MLTKVTEIVNRVLSLDGFPKPTALFLSNTIRSGEFSRWNDSRYRKQTLLGILTADKSTSVAAQPVSEVPKKRSLSIADFRMHAFTISGIRTYGAPASGVYGLLTSDPHGIPQSGVISGCNGSGKTSIYVALELLGLHRSPLTEVLSDDPALHRKINTHSPADGDRRPVDSSVIAYTPSGRFSFSYAGQGNNLEQLSVPEAFYCSEYDVASLLNNDISLEYLCRQLGIFPIYEFKKFLDFIYSAISLLNEIISQYNTPRTSIIPDKNSKHAINGKFLSFRKRYGLPTSLKLADLTEYPLKDIEALRNECLTTINLAISEFCVKANRIVRDLVDTFRLPDTPHSVPEFSVTTIRTGPDSGYRTVTTTARIGSSRFNPRQIYNNFTFRIYCTAVKIAFACTAMRVHRINFPIVIDDIFDGSDFENRSHIRNFVDSLAANYARTPDAASYPLQIILLTQDELVAEGFHDGLRLNNPDDNVWYIRLHRPEDCDAATDLTEVNLNGETVRIMQIGTRC